MGTDVWLTPPEILAPLGDFDRNVLLRSTTTGGLLRETIDLTLGIEPLLTAPPIDPDDL